MKERDVFLVMDLLAAHYDLIEVNKDFSDKALASGNAEEYAKIAVSGDPLRDVRALERVEFVMKAGRVYLSPDR